ncbi:hypothetical protein A0J57_18860 [Sphingobium sp. 22B]|uniref:2-keto-4-pentenoate hydratase n=1 Tax=unclassified Sphingobium TaxID=2611147 RepID=UPI000784C55E|nr:MULTISPECIES: fumarylacetoacetate hydrolase family protein [unclassified Sphingobium]KXU30500.1 hypothetical protein AXW74_17465 [Sphingobium sp. AM]KYC30759.1 hypothetical protein A0J57_18860 [Sphingobium sp. 22B]OAP30057.1 hypothetical protein A8O16_20445 [Sphingobium sp. 20006FA]
MTTVQRATQDFWERIIAHEPLPAEWAGRLSIDEGYAVQLEIAELHARAGNARTGWKVAATNPAVQQQLGVSEPAFGSLRNATTHGDGYDLPAGKFVVPHVESEICFKAGEGIATVETEEDVLAALECCFPSFELIEKRVPVLDMGVAIADNVEHTSIVLGAPHPVQGLTFESIACRLTFNGEEVATGTGANVLGNPLRSVLWLKQALARYGRRIEPGDLIMTGSLVRQFPLKAGDKVTAEFSTIGKVSITVSD